MMPNVIHPPSHLSELSRLAWDAAGWRARVAADGSVESWGPASVTRTIGLDVLDMTGCIDARL